MTSPKAASPIASSKPFLVLASESPRRLALLAQAGIVPDAVRAAGIDETVHRKELPRPYAGRLAAAKARAAALGWDGAPGALFIAADTVVSVGRRILPKAETEEQVRECLALLSGRAHRVTTAVAVLGIDGKLRTRTVELGSSSTASIRPPSNAMPHAAKASARPAAMPYRAAPKSSCAS